MSPSKVQRLNLKYFTAFELADFEFCPGINVLIGANSTGKTHVLKIIYTLLKVCETVHQKPVPRIESLIFSKLLEIFRPCGTDFLNSISPLIHYPSSADNASVSLTCSDINMDLKIHRSLIGEKKFPIDFNFIAEKLPYPSSPVYLPPHEFLSINKGFISSYTKSL